MNEQYKDNIMAKDGHNVMIIERYNNSYILLFPIKELIAELLLGISNQYLCGLKAVILDSSAGLNRKGRRQKTLSRERRVAVVDCEGVYNQKWHDGPATIQLFVDNIIEPFPKWIFEIQFFKRMIFAEVLFHELGHHIHYTIAPEYKEREDVAEKWRKRLTKEYTSKRYRYLKPFKYLLKIIARIIVKIIEFFLEKRKNRN